MFTDNLILSTNTPETNDAPETSLSWVLHLARNEYKNIVAQFFQVIKTVHTVRQHPDFQSTS